MSHRREEKERLRQERMEKAKAAQAAARRKQLLGRVAAAVLSVAALAAIIVALASGGGDDAPEGGEAAGGDAIQVSYPDDGPELPEAVEFELEPAAKDAGCELMDPPNEGQSHVEPPVTYKANPPTSGNHFEIPAEDGAYESPPQTERAVHTLEHGRVWIQFKPTLAQPQIDKLYAVFKEDEYHMVLSPNGTKMPFEVAVTAWDHSLVCDKMGDKAIDAIRAFRETYRDQGPERVP